MLNLKINLVTLFSLLFIQVYAQDSLFEQVFKKSMVSTVSLPVIDGGNYYGDLKVRIINTDSISEFEREGFKKILDSLIDKKVVKKIFKEKGEFLSIDQLNDTGVILQYDVQNLVLQLEIDTKILKVKETNLAFNERPEWAKNAIVSSGFSGSINLFNFYQKRTGSESDSTYTGDQNYSFNYKRWSLFAQTSYEDDREREFTRQDIRFSYDDPKRLIRYEVGDLRYNTELYQGFIPAAGLQISSNFNLNPYRLFNPTANREIFLTNPATVRVFVNSIMIRTIKLPAGRHLIDELPLNEGLNNVTLEILDSRGRQEKISFERFTSYALVKKGIQEFSYIVGKTSEDVDNVRTYDEDEKDYVYLANHLWGVSEFANLGFNINGSRQQNLTGVLTRHQSRWGFLEFNFTRSQLIKGASGEKGSGFAGRVTHRFTDYSRQRRLKNIQLSLEYLSPRFTQMGTVVFNNYATVTPEINYSQFVTDNVNIRLGGRYRYLK